jgi:hypothetical protein
MEAPKPAGTAFGRFTAVGPAGYAVQPLTNGLSFDGENRTIFVVDGAEIGPPKPGGCQSQLEWFANGVISGLANTPLTITVTKAEDAPHGCRLSATIVDAQQQTVGIEAVSLDLGGAGPAFGMLLHAAADAGAQPLFDKVVASIRASAP